MLKSVVSNSSGRRRLRRTLFRAVADLCVQAPYVGACSRQSLRDEIWLLLVAMFLAVVSAADNSMNRATEFVDYET